MYRLLFDNPVFEMGLNYTVRAGSKWASRLKPGDWVEVGETAAVITEALYTSWEFLPQRVFDFEHDPVCRTKEGLKAKLERIYGVADIDHVTCIGFVLWPLPWEILE
jgi:hypothetical protein